MRLYYILKAGLKNHHTISIQDDAIIPDAPMFSAPALDANLYYIKVYRLNLLT